VIILSKYEVVDEVKGLYKILPLRLFRKTPGVIFDLLPLYLLPRIDAIDRVIHEREAISPGPIGDIKRPWYMHPHQADNLIVLHGWRNVELYNLEHGKIEIFEIAADYIKKDNKMIYDGGAMLLWPTNVFHRIISGKEGSASINFARRSEGFDIKTNFNIYDLNIKNGEYRIIREGFRDQMNI
jgi:hypothetical protein